MAITMADLVSEVKRRATKNQGGTQFDAGIKIVINTSLSRVAREAKWRSLRRSTTFNTVGTYSTGSGAASVTNNSLNVTVTGATFLTDNITTGRFINFSGSNTYYKIATITGETTLTLNQVFDGTTSSTNTYSILGQEDYTLPIQIGHSAFLWHRAYGYPVQLNYVPAQEFYAAGVIDTLTNIPLNYRMWGMDAAIEQPVAASVVQISSSSSSDTAIAVTIFGTVSGYPDYEIITTNGSNGTTAVNGTKSFTYIERIVKNQTTVGRITCTTNTANVTVGVLPVGATTTGPYYTKVQLYPLPTSIFPVNVYYYKMPYQLINDGDVHELGEQFNEAIILLATAKMKAEQNMKEDADFFELYQDEIKTLKSTNLDKIDWRIVLQRPDGNYWNNWTGGLVPQQVGNSGWYNWARGGR